MKARYTVLMIAALAAATMGAASTASADGICVCGMKRPLRAEGATHMPRPLRTEGLHHLKKPLRAEGNTVVHRPLLADGSGNPIPCCRRPLVA